MFTGPPTGLPTSLPSGIRKVFCPPVSRVLSAGEKDSMADVLVTLGR